MTILKIQERVKELMIEQNLDVFDELLFAQVTIIYLQAQRELLVEQRKGSQ